MSLLFMRDRVQFPLAHFPSASRSPPPSSHLLPSIFPHAYRLVPTCSLVAFLLFHLFPIFFLVVSFSSHLLPPIFPHTPLSPPLLFPGSLPICFLVASRLLPGCLPSFLPAIRHLRIEPYASHHLLGSLPLICFVPSSQLVRLTSWKEKLFRMRRSKTRMSCH